MNNTPFTYVASVHIWASNQSKTIQHESTEPLEAVTLALKELPDNMREEARESLMRDMLHFQSWRARDSFGGSGTSIRDYSASYVQQSGCLGYAVNLGLVFRDE